MRRREFITLIGGASAAWPLAARAQQPDRMRHIGVLMAHAESDPEFQTYVSAFREGLQKLGWTEGRNIQLDFRWGALDDTGDEATIRVRTHRAEARPHRYAKHTANRVNAATNAHNLRCFCDRC